MITIFGVDPGFSGAIAELREDGRLSVYDMPTVPGAKGKTELNHAAILDLLTAGIEDTTVMWLERVGARPNQGVSSMFRFGQQLGALEMAAAAQGLPLRFVTPATWKAHFGLSADKGVARGEAMRRFPAHAAQFSRAKDDGRAEATLIALYGMEHTT